MWMRSIARGTTSPSPNGGSCLCLCGFVFVFFGGREVHPVRYAQAREDAAVKNRMRAMVLNDPRAASGAVGLVASERPIPRCGAEEVLIHVRVCGVCRTDLD